MAILDHINIDLDGDGVKERYDLRDKQTQQSLLDMYNIFNIDLDNIKAEITEKLTWKFFKKWTGGEESWLPDEFNEIYIITHNLYPNKDTGNNATAGLTRFYISKTMIDKLLEDYTSYIVPAQFFEYEHDGVKYHSRVKYELFAGRLGDVSRPKIQLSEAVAPNGNNMLDTCENYLFYR